MPQAADGPAKHGRSLVGFYVALGAVAAVVGLGAVMWKPLMMRYYEWRITRPGASATYDDLEAARGLARMGPAAAGTTRRILHGPVDNSHAALWGIRVEKATWALPLLVELALKNNDRNVDEVEFARNIDEVMFDIDCLTHEDFRGLEDTSVVVVQKRLSDWWEREGKAKYGGDVK
jgi:hypothetical protein